MINKTPTNLDKFPVPVSGQKIPGGWFARLVSFINSLVLHGDGQYLTVKHTQAGQTIAPTLALLQALGQRGAPPAAGGGGAVGFPNFYSTSTIAVDSNGSYSLIQNMWLIGRVQASAVSVADASFYLNYVTTGSSSTPIQIKLLMSDTDSVYRETFVCLPIPSGLTITFSRDDLAMVISAMLYPCL